MSADFIANISQASLNQISADIYPKIKDKLTQTYKLDKPKVTAGWAVSKPLEFQLTGSSNTFTIAAVLEITTRPGTTGGDNSKTSETVNANGHCTVAVVSNSTLIMHLKDISFDTKDPFVKAFLNEKKHDIATTLDKLVHSLKIPLGNVEGVALQGFRAGVLDQNLYVAGSVMGSADVTQLSSGEGLNLTASNELMMTMFHNDWWNKSKHTFSTKNVDITIGRYTFEVTNDKLPLVLYTSGDLHVDVGLGTARWNLKIDPIHVDILISAEDGIVKLEAGSVSTPNVVATPSNFLATLPNILPVPITVFINPLIGDIVGRSIPNGIKDHLHKTLFSMPSWTDSFGGVPYTITPSNPSIAVIGSRVALTSPISVQI